MQITPFKGRHIDYTKPVKIYKNLHNGMFSIRQNNLVIGHCEQFVLSNPTYKVNEKARQAVIQTGQKNVHSFLVGYIWEQQKDIFINNGKLLKGESLMKSGKI